MEDLKVLSILGVGTFGRVKLVLNAAEDNLPCALKCMRKGQVIALKQVEHVMNEKALLEQCQQSISLGCHDRMHPFASHVGNQAVVQDASKVEDASHLPKCRKL